MKINIVLCREIANILKISKSNAKKIFLASLVMLVISVHDIHKEKKKNKQKI